VVDDNIENDPDRVRLPILLVVVSRINQIDQVLLGAEVLVDIEVVVDVVPVIDPIVVAEDRREPDRAAPHPGYIVKVLGDSLDVAPIKGIIRGYYSFAPLGAQYQFTVFVIGEPVHQEKIDEFLAPFSIKVKVFLPRDR
jgi:hypothetical protein